MELFSNEQAVYDEAMGILQSVLESMAAIENLQKSFQSFRLSPSRQNSQQERIKELKKIDIDLYSKLVFEYGRLLSQLKQQSDVPERIDISTEQVSIALSETLTDAYFDDLTGVFSKRYLFENLGYVMDSLQYSDDALSVVSVAIDFFEEYKIERGEIAADDCARKVAMVLKSCLFHGNDFVAHMGEGKFMVVLPQTKKDGVRQVAERFLGQVTQLKISNITEAELEFMTVSIGCVTGVRGRSVWTLHDFILCAEEALHLAKSNGRNRYVYQAVKAV